MLVIIFGSVAFAIISQAWLELLTIYPRAVYSLIVSWSLLTFILSYLIFKTT